MNPVTRDRHLPVPALLEELLDRGLWRHPGDHRLREIIPWFEDPLDFLASIAQMRADTHSLRRAVTDPAISQYLRVMAGDERNSPVTLPWVDIEQTLLIAVNRKLGDDTCLALDYRTDASDPRVIGSDVWTLPSRCIWRFVSPTFSAFAALLSRDGR